MTNNVIAWLVTWRAAMGGVVKRRVRAASAEEAWEIVSKFRTSSALRMPSIDLCTIRRDDRGHPGVTRRKTSQQGKHFAAGPREVAPERTPPKRTPPSRASRRGMVK